MDSETTQAHGGAARAVRRLPRGRVLTQLTWTAAVTRLLLLFVVRPAAGWVGFVRSGLRARQRAVISFFGIRSVGLLYYLAHGLTAARFAETELLWATVAFPLLVSIVPTGRPPLS